MTRDELNNAYFEWMYQLVCNNERYSKKTSYRKLMMRLHDTEFYYILPMDGNRAEDGVDLRYRFGYENSYEQAAIADALDDRPCSILEMMIALAIRCEEHIMDNSDIGDRTGQWFWSMIVSLGLGPMTDAKFDKEFVDDILVRFLERDYEPNGEGGLFTIKNCNRDQRSVEIWYQMHKYLEDIV